MDKQKLLGLLLADVGVDAGRVRELADALLEVVDALAHLVDARDDLVRHALEARLPACGFAGRFLASRRRRAGLSVVATTARWLPDAGGAHLLEQVRDEGRQVLGIGRRFRLHDDSCNALRRHRRAPISVRCDWQLNLCCVQHPRPQALSRDLAKHCVESRVMAVV